MKQPIIKLNPEYAELRSKLKSDPHSIDIFIPERVDIPPGQTKEFHPDFEVDFTECNVFGVLQPTDSLGGRTAYILQSTLIHPWHEGKITIRLFNPTTYPIELAKGEKVAQMAFMFASRYQTE